MRSSRQTLRIVAAFAIAAALCLPASGQDTRWRPVGPRGIELGLAGPAGSPVAETWFSATGGTLYVMLRSGQLWETADLGETWKPGEPGALSRRGETLGRAAGSEDVMNRVLRDPYGPGTSYSLGHDLLRSYDGGKSWANLTGGSLGSVIGNWQSSMAFSPVDPNLVVVGNSMGLWKSFDRGVTWTSLNRALPNFPRAEFAPADFSGGVRIVAESIGTLELSGSGTVGFWQLQKSRPVESRRFSGDDATRRAEKLAALPEGFDVSYRVWRGQDAISPDLTACSQGECADPRRHFVTALSSNGLLWAGTSDGRIWVSRDEGWDWRLSYEDFEGQRVQQIWVDPDNSSAAVAIVGARVLRSTNGGTFWDDMSSNLPAGDWTSVVGHPAAQTLYVAGTAGVFYSRVDLDKPGPAGAWVALNASLLAATVDDLMLDSASGRLYVTQPGYGVFQRRVPAAEEAIEAFNAADLSRRAAAPGSLLTIRGIKADRATAGGMNAPILSAESHETQVQLPFSHTGRSLRLSLGSDAGTFELSVPFMNVSPAIFIEDGDPLILDAGSGSIIGWHWPARVGSTLLIMATGLGRVNPVWPAGVAAPLYNAPKPVAKVTASLNGAPLKVISSQLAGGYVGTYVVEVELPVSVIPGLSEIRIFADGIGSNAVRLVIER